MMTTFDLVQIQEFVAGLDARMGSGLNGAKDDPAALAAALRGHAELCHEFTEKVRAWGRAVFSGRIEFDSAVESVVLAEGSRLTARAGELHALAATCGDLASWGEFPAIVDRMNKLLDHWVRPQLAVGPGPRHWQYVTPEMIEQARRVIDALPPLPADWPFTAEQRRELGLQ